MAPEVIKMIIPKKVSSVENQSVRKAMEAKTRKRGGKDYFLAEGTHLIEMAVASSAKIEEVFFTSEFIKTLQGRRVLKRLSQTESPPGSLLEVPVNILAKISDTETPQGIIAVIAQPSISLGFLEVIREPLFVLCDGIGDPGNLGTIIRVADAVAANAVVVLPGSCDPYSPKAVRATAGSIFNVPVIGTVYSGLFAYLDDMGIDLIVTDVKAGKSLYSCDLKGPVAVALGNEARGVSDALTSRAVGAIRIPIPGRAESLNVAVAAAICLYEALRQRAVGTG